MNVLLAAEHAVPGDIVQGTWSAAYPEPRIIEAVEYAPEHSTTGPAYRFGFADGGSRIYYGTCRLRIERPT